MHSGIYSHVAMHYKQFTLSDVASDTTSYMHIATIMHAYSYDIVPTKTCKKVPEAIYIHIYRYTTSYDQ